MNPPGIQFIGFTINPKSSIQASTILLLHNELFYLPQSRVKSECDALIKLLDEGTASYAENNSLKIREKSEKFLKNWRISFNWIFISIKYSWRGLR